MSNKEVMEYDVVIVGARAAAATIRAARNYEEKCEYAYADVEVIGGHVVCLFVLCSAA